MKKNTVHETAEEKVNVAAESIKQEDNYLNLRIPRIPLHKFRLHSPSLNVYLVFVVIIFAFLLGMLTNKVMYLQTQLKEAKDAAAKAAANTQAAAAPQPTVPPYANVDNGHFPLKGDNGAKVTMVEFSDFQCPFCKQYFDATESQVDSDYVKTGKIKFAYRQFPLTTIHPNAYLAANAGECANDQGKFWEYHDLLFKNQASWSAQAAADATSSLVDLAGQTGMDTDQFKSCLTSQKDKKNVDDDMAAGNAAQVDGTPTFFINGFRLVGAVPYDQIKQAIEQELKKKS